MNPANLVESVDDPTGQMSQEDLNAANISNLMDAVNGLQASTGNIITQPTYIEINDGTSNRVLIGYNQATGTWGLFATPPGTDISDATTPQQLSLTSDYPSLLVIDQGTVVIPSISIGAGLTASRTRTIFYTLPVPTVPLILTSFFIPGGASYSFQGMVPLTFIVGSGTGVVIQELDFLSLVPGSSSATLTAQGYNGSSSTDTFPSYSVNYFVLQKTA